MVFASFFKQKISVNCDCSFCLLTNKSADINTEYSFVGDIKIINGVHFTIFYGYHEKSFYFIFRRLFSVHFYYYISINTNHKINNMAFKLSLLFPISPYSHTKLIKESCYTFKTQRCVLLFI